MMNYFRDVSQIIVNTLNDFEKCKNQLAPSEEFSYLDILRNELISFACFICAGDGNFGNNEICMISAISNQRVDEKGIIDKANQFKKTDEELKHENNCLLRSINFSIQLDNIRHGGLIKKIDYDDSDDIVVKVLSLFEIVGGMIIDLDGDIANGEINRYSAFIENLKKFISEQIEKKAKQQNSEPQKLKKEQEKSDNTNLSNLNFDQLMMELNNLTGLDNIKKEISSLVNMLKIKKIRQDNGLQTPDISLHMVFLGNPGTGKTTIARMLAKIYKSIGVLKTGQLIEVDRSGLIAQYVGHTEQKTLNAIDSAKGGILFIDEAYALTQNEGERDFGNEAIQTLLKAMEDRRNEFIVIVAGYPDLMQKFINSNPGLKSRFNRFIEFKDYNEIELQEILEKMCEKYSFKMDKQAKEYTKAFFLNATINKSENFSNARLVRNIFEKVIIYQSNRLALQNNLSAEELCVLKKEDFSFI